MSEASSELVLEMAPEPSIPLVSLSEFHDAKQPVLVGKAENDLEMEKKGPIAPQLLELWELNDEMDLTLRVGRRTHRCNRLRFLCYSGFAKKALEDGQRELELPKDRVPWLGLLGVCDSIRKPVASLERRHIVKILVAAIYLEVETLVQQVWFSLELVNEFREDMAYALSHEWRSLATEVPVSGLDRSILIRIQRFFLTLVASADYVLLPVEHVHFLLKSENIAVNSEKEIFFAALRWLTYDWPARAEHAMLLMKTVRILLLPYSFIMELREPTDVPEINLIMENQEFQQIIEEASIKTLICYNDGSKFFEKLYDVFNIKVPHRRPFIYDNLCAYHSPSIDKFPINFTYDEFLTYLSTLQNAGVYSWKKLKVELKPSPYINCEYE